MKYIIYIILTLLLISCKKDDSEPPAIINTPSNNLVPDRLIDGFECNSTSHNDIWIGHNQVNLPELVPAGAKVYVSLYGDPHQDQDGNTTWSPSCYTLTLNGNNVATFTGGAPQVFEYIVP